MNHIYHHCLEHVSPGRLFGMVNYEGAFLRVVGDNLLDDGIHLPIVELSTGRMFYMAKSKPCVILYPGESPNT